MFVVAEAMQEASRGPSKSPSGVRYETEMRELLGGTTEYSASGQGVIDFYLSAPHLIFDYLRPPVVEDPLV